MDSSEKVYINGEDLSIDSMAFFSFVDEIMDTEKIPKMINYLKNRGIKEVRVLKNIEVSKENRGKGLGSLALAEFCKQTPVLLLCDKLEIQENNFDLEAFYIKKGFEIIPFSGLSGPFMLKV